MKIDEMQAGRELDALVAERFGLPLESLCARYHETDGAQYDEGYGWSGWCYTCNDVISVVPPEPAHYSTDIAAAWPLLDRFGFVVGPRFDPGWGERPRNGWYVYRNWEDTARDAFSEDGGECALAEAETLPLAICRAALKATEGA